MILPNSILSMFKVGSAELWCSVDEARVRVCVCVCVCVCVRARARAIYLAALDLSCSMRDLVQNLEPLHWELGVLITGPPGKSQMKCFKCCFGLRYFQFTMGLLGCKCRSGERSVFM